LRRSGATGVAGVAGVEGGDSIGGQSFTRCGVLWTECSEQKNNYVAKKTDPVSTVFVRNYQEYVDNLFIEN